MSLKAQSDRPAVVVTVPPKWGILAEAGETVSSVRFECADGAYSYPYHTLSRWVLEGSMPEILVIRAGSDRVIVCGRQLEQIRDALDSGRLRVVRCTNERYGNGNVSTVVERIVVEPEP